jgi:hypothetical protein
VEEHVEINGVITASGNRLLEMSGSATEVTTDLVTGEVISTDVSFGHSSQLSTMDGTFLQHESALTSDTFTGPSFDGLITCTFMEVFASSNEVVRVDHVASSCVPAT